jgi:uncharacterized protein YggT (Ycf19 family)
MKGSPILLLLSLALKATCIFGRSGRISSISPLPRRAAIGRPLLGRTTPLNRQPLAYAIPGNGLAEQALVGGGLNFLSIFNYCVTARVLLSWFPQAASIGALRPLFLLVDPYLNTFRGLGLNFAGIDFSVLPAFFLLTASQNALVSLGADGAPLHFKPLPPRGVTPRPQPIRTSLNPVPPPGLIDLFGGRQ